MMQLRDLGTWSGGNTPSKANAAYWTNGTVPWVSPKDMKVDEIISSEDRITEVAVSDGRVSLIPEGSVLFVTRSGILSHTFPVAVTKLPVTINQDLKALSPKAGISPKYVAHAIRGASQRILKQCSKHGTTVASVETNALLDFEIPIVGIDEQHRIVAEIEKQFSRLDEAVAGLQRVKSNLKRYKAAVLKSAVAGRLVETEADLARREGRNYETGAQLLQRILDTRRSQWQGKGKYKEPAAPDTTDYPELPEGWVWASADQLMSLITDGEHITPKREAQGVLLLSARNVLNDAISLDDVDYIPEDEYARISRRLSIAAGDLLLSCSGSVGRTCVVPQGMRFSLVRSVAVLRPVLASAQYLCYQLQSPLGQSQINDRKTQTAQANLFQGKIRQLVFALSPLAEQHRNVAEVDRLLSIAREVEAEVETNLKRAQGLRQAVLRTAFSMQANNNSSEVMQ